jgi:hypothetical protein
LLTSGVSRCDFPVFVSAASETAGSNFWRVKKCCCRMVRLSVLFQNSRIVKSYSLNICLFTVKKPFTAVSAEATPKINHPLQPSETWHHNIFITFSTFGVESDIQILFNATIWMLAHSTFIIRLRYISTPVLNGRRTYKIWGSHDFLVLKINFIIYAVITGLLLG